MNMTPLSGSNKIVVVGGGAAGMMAAGMAAQAGAQVTLLEQNGRLGKKLLITGKGRCNVTNDCPWQDVLQSVPTNPRFLYSALAGFSPADAKKFFEDYGCALKTERGNRVFPVSDRSQSVLDALERFLRAYHVHILPRKAAEIAVSDGRVTGVKTAEGPVPADCVVLATGGLSYPATGLDRQRLRHGAGDRAYDHRADRFARPAGREGARLRENAGAGPEKHCGQTCKHEGKDRL